MSGRSTRILWLAVTTIAVVTLALVSAYSGPDDPEDAVTKATIADLAWLAARWEGRFFNQGPMEEIWHPPLGNCMTGTFRAIRGGKAFLYEMLLIEESDDGITLHLRHFDPGLKAWPTETDALTFPLKERTATKAVFEDLARGFPQRMVYERKGENALEIRLEGTQKEGPHTVTFAFTQAN